MQRDVREGGLYRSHHVGNKSAGIVILLIQRNPATGRLAGVEPHAGQRALAISGRRRNQCQRPVQIILQTHNEIRTRFQIRGNRRSIELSGQNRRHSGRRGTHLVNSVCHGCLALLLRTLLARHTCIVQQSYAATSILYGQRHYMVAVWLEQTSTNRVVIRGRW